MLKAIRFLTITILFTAIIYSQTTVTAVLSLTDASGSEVLNYESGDLLYVRITDADANDDGGTAETISVSMTSETETTVETLTLTETGINTGIFEGNLGFQEATANNGDGTLQVSRGDKLTGSYDDPADDFGNPVTVTDVAFYGVTLMSGTLYGSNTWNVAGSPYLVTGDVIVHNDATLTIEPGVEVRFVPLSDDLSAGNDVNRSELYVYGTIIAEGTVSDSIVFTSNSEDPSSGDWYGIYLRDSNAQGSFAYNLIEYGTYGINMQTLYGSTSDTVKIVHNHIRYAGTGIRDYYGYRYYVIEDNVLENLSGQGISFDNASRQSIGVIQNNIISQVNSSGIYINEQ